MRPAGLGKESGPGITDERVVGDREATAAQIYRSAAACIITDGKIIRYGMRPAGLGKNSGTGITDSFSSCSDRFTGPQSVASIRTG